MANEIRNGGSKMRVVVRLLGHRDDAGAWEIHDFFERSVVGTCAIALSSASPPQRARGRWPSPLCTDTWKKQRDPVCQQPYPSETSSHLGDHSGASRWPEVFSLRPGGKPVDIYVGSA